MMDELKGRAIKSARINPDKTLLVFDTDEGEIAYYAEGDCCSESWFNHVTGAEYLAGSTVKEVETSDVDGQLAGTRQEADQVAFVTMPTSIGYTTFEFRNSSNGYYGGWASRVKREQHPDLFEGELAPLADF